MNNELPKHYLKYDPKCGGNKCIYCNRFAIELALSSNLHHSYLLLISDGPDLVSTTKWINDNCMPCITEEERIIKDILE